MSPGKGYIRSLDGLRAIAILLVMTFHARLNEFGWMGVQLFFVLSGYLITGILWKEKFRDVPAGEKLKRFWYRRTLRIFPLYFGYLLVWTLTYLLFRFPDYFGKYAAYLFTYTFNYTRSLPGWEGNPLFTHLWSLCVEEQFYLFFPLLVLLLPVRWVKRLLPLVILITPLVRYLLGEYYFSKGFEGEAVADLIYWHTASHLDAFFIGGLIPVFGLQQRVSRPRRLLWITGALALLAGVINFWATASPGASFFGGWGYAHGQGEGLQYVWQYTVLNAFFAALILNLVAGNSFSGLRRWLEAEVMVRIGQVSYGMYLFHWAVFVYPFNTLFPNGGWWQRLLYFLPYTVVLYVLAALSFRFFERRFLELKEKKKVEEGKPVSGFGAGIGKA
jgi:peptidoglycan/LPS O-acetylase OafA/YrhL